MQDPSPKTCPSYIYPLYLPKAFPRIVQKNHRARVALPAFKAYIEVDNAAGAAAPLFVALPTAVEAAKVQTTKAGTTNDLTGRRVQQTAKGQVYTSAMVRNSFSNKTHPTYESLYLSQSSKSSAQR